MAAGVSDSCEGAFAEARARRDDMEVIAARAAMVPFKTESVTMTDRFGASWGARAGGETGPADCTA